MKKFMRLVYGLLATAWLIISILYFVPMPAIINNYFLAHLDELYGNKCCSPEQEAHTRQFASQCDKEFYTHLNFCKGDIPWLSYLHTTYQDFLQRIHPINKE